MVDDDISSYVNRAQSEIDEYKSLVTSDQVSKMVEKIDNVCMLYILHELHKNFESV